MEEWRNSMENFIPRIKWNKRTGLPLHYFALLCWKSSPIKGWGQGGRLKLLQADWQDALLQGLLGYDLSGREVNSKLTILFIPDWSLERISQNSRQHQPCWVKYSPFFCAQKWPRKSSHCCGLNYQIHVFQWSKCSVKVCYFYPFYWAI